MTDIYIATPTQADYDALMRLAEAKGYKWIDGELPTGYDTWTYAEEQTVVHLYNDFQDGRRMMRDDRAYYESQNATIETIQKLAGIKAIWNVKPEYLDVFSDEKFNTSDIIKDWALNDGVIILLENGSYDLGFEEVYKALAVEYKPKESEKVMSEKVKLPKFMCEWLDEITSPRAGLLVRPDQYPLMSVWDIYRLKREVSGAVGDWLDKPDNQWKLIDALRYGYEAEPEQLYYVMLVRENTTNVLRNKGFLNQDKSDKRLFASSKLEVCNAKTKFTMSEIEAIDPRYKAFAVKVEEVDGNESKNCN